MEVNDRTLRDASARVGDRTGWDFSRMSVIEDVGRWRYEDVVRDESNPRDAVLDIGTGGGEVFARLVTSMGWATTVAIDHQSSMAVLAHRRLTSSDVLVADAISLPFVDGTVDVVLNRHAQVWPGEVARVLRPGGRFVLQQVGRRNAQEIFDAFGWGSNWDQFMNDRIPPRECSEIAQEFVDLGLRVVRLDEYTAPYVFVDLDSLVFFLKAAPFPEAFDPERHIDAVNRLLAAATSPRGIETTAHRQLLVVRK